MKSKQQIERRLKTLETSLENFKMNLKLGSSKSDDEMMKTTKSYIETTELKIEVLKWVLES